MNEALKTTARGLKTFGSDVVDGFFEITHNGSALVGLATVFAVLALTARPDLRATGEQHLMGWLESRKPVVVVDATALNPPPSTARPRPARTNCPSSRPPWPTG